MTYKAETSKVPGLTVAHTHKYLPNSCLLTDFYQFSMAQAWFNNQHHDKTAIFNLFFRRLPFNGNFVVAAGINDALLYIENFKFDEDSLSYLSPMFDKDFIDYLRNLKPQINIYGIEEGTIVFPHEPILRIEGPLALCQLLETPLLNIINFQSLIATKAARIRLAAGDKKLSDFGLRRAQGFDGAISASKAAYLGGIDTTSNLWAAKHFDIPLGGTIGHSFIMSYDKQLDAFNNFLDAKTNNRVLLLDTYLTPQGIKDAIIAFKRLHNYSAQTLAVRLDSGDLLALSRQTRSELDRAGLKHCMIIASGDLDEYSIQALNLAQAPIDIFGVGTRLICAHNDPALSGVYKLAAIKNGGKWRDTAKISDQLEKNTWPGRQALARVYGPQGPIFDHIFDQDLGCEHKAKHLQKLMFEQGRISQTPKSLLELKKQVHINLAEFPTEIRSLEKTSSYPVKFDQSLINKQIILRETL